MATIYELKQAIKQLFLPEYAEVSVVYPYSDDEYPDSTECNTINPADVEIRIN